MNALLVVALLSLVPAPAPPPTKPRAAKRTTWASCWALDLDCKRAPDHFTARACRRARACFNRAEERIR